MIPRMSGMSPYAPVFGQRPQMNDVEGRMKQQESERDRKFQSDLAHVQSHEAAHYSAAGEFAAGPPVINADYGKKVVYGGHVPIKMSFGKTAEDAQRSGDKIAAAALSPGDPSSQDRAIASTAKSTGSALAASRKAEESKKTQAKDPLAAPPITQPPAQNPFRKPL